MSTNHINAIEQLNHNNWLRGRGDIQLADLFEDSAAQTRIIEKLVETISMLSSEPEKLSNQRATRLKEYLRFLFPSKPQKMSAISQERSEWKEFILSMDFTPSFLIGLSWTVVELKRMPPTMLRSIQTHHEKISDLAIRYDFRRLFVRTVFSSIINDFSLPEPKNQDINFIRLKNWHHQNFNLQPPKKNLVPPLVHFSTAPRQDLDEAIAISRACEFWGGKFNYNLTEAGFKAIVGKPGMSRQVNLTEPFNGKVQPYLVVPITRESFEKLLENKDEYIRTS